MTTGIESQLITWFTNYAYQPELIYLGIVCFMFASSFGVPIPEEIIILSAGLVAHISLFPADYPPPPGAGDGVEVYTVALVCFAAVFFSDLLIYFLGRVFGEYLLQKRWFRRSIHPRLWRRVQNWMMKYGFWASGIFRFIPGLRFPGHLACGMTRVPISRFVMVDGGAALFSVPSQILLIGFYGRPILEQLSNIKMIGLLTLGVIILILALKYFRRRRKWRTDGVSNSP